MENLEFLAAAYAVFWLLTFAYLFYIGRRQQSLEKEVKLLENLLDEGDE